MKMISKFVVVFLMSFMFSNTFALQVATPLKNVSLIKPASTRDSQVMLINLTHENYMAHSLYRGTGQEYSLPLLAAGTSQDRILYPISYPVYDVCLDVIRQSTGLSIFQDCLAYGTIYIRYAADKKTVVVS
jgi:hypothetical protein